MKKAKLGDIVTIGGEMYKVFAMVHETPVVYFQSILPENSDTDSNGLDRNYPP